MNKSNIARSFRDKYGMEMPTKKLARIMFSEHPLLFRDAEDARMCLRYIEGKNGTAKNKVAGREYFMDTPRPHNPYSLPKSEEKEYVPHVIEGPQRIAALFDIHCPYHSIEALTAALEWLEKQEPTMVVIGGDFFDFYGLSRFLKDPDKRSPADEIRTGIELLKAIYVALKPKNGIVFKLGNHDERFQHFLWQKMGEMSGLQDLEELKEITLENIVKKRIGPDIPMQFVGDKRIIKAGALNITHGHEFPSGISSPVNIARGLYLRAKANTICGHHHKNSHHVETNINDEMITTWSIGCLCELNPLYMPINSWNHGVCLITLEENGDFNVDARRIKNGKIL